MGNDTLNKDAFIPFIDKLKSLYLWYLDENENNATGKLKDFDYDIEFDGQSFRVYFNLQYYWKWVEYGRRAGKQPPTDSIEKWITIKKIIPYKKNGKIPSTKQLAFAISKSIGKHGTKAHEPLKKAMGSQEATNIVSQIKSLLIKQINDEIKNVIKPIIK